MKLYYCAFESIFDPIFDSQVLAYSEKINDKLTEVNASLVLVVFGSIADLFRKNYLFKKRSIKKLLKNKCIFSFKLPYFYRFLFIFKFSSFLNSIICLLFFIFVLKLKRNAKIIVHCRTEVASFILLRVKKLFYRNIKIICDCRGIGSKEILYKYGKKKGLPISKNLEEVEIFARKNSDCVFCVSNSFKKYILRRSKGEIKKIKVMPCCIDIEKFKYDSHLRKKVRNEMGINKRFVILYSGSLNEWQLPLEMIKIFKIFKKIIKNSIFILFTKDIEYVKRLFLNSGLEKGSYIIDYKPHNIINKYLLLGDLGLLIREKNDVNKVAFPVKFSEYVRCGVPVLSSITSDVISMISKFKLGYKLSNYSDSHEIRKIALNIKSNMAYLKSNEYKSRISKIIGREVDWERYINSAINVYRGMLFDEDQD